MIDHKDMVSKLAKPGQEIVDNITAEEAHIIHMAIGVSGEVAELLAAVTKDDRENALEELGDIEFYFEGLCQGANMIPVEAIMEPGTITEDPLPNIIVCAGYVLDIAKKIVMYKDVTKWDLLRLEMQRFRHHLDEFYSATEFTRSEVIAGNIKKLSKRYEGFNYSDSAAKARADK